LVRGKVSSAYFFEVREKGNRAVNASSSKGIVSDKIMECCGVTTLESSHRFPHDGPPYSGNESVSEIFLVDILENVGLENQ
jgi:hypothetical protein